MSKQELNRFQALLKAKVAELERFTRHREGIAVERSADELEQIQGASERAIAVSNLDREFNQLRNVRAALRRIQEGKFGACLDCEQEIHQKRLLAVPWALLCIRCQEVADANPEEMQTPARVRLAA
jgi:DnaK suppressor protein